MKMNEFIEAYNKIISENDEMNRPEYDKAISTLEENGYSPLTGRMWDDGYATYWGKKYSENILFVIKTMGSNYEKESNGGSYATKLHVLNCEIVFTKVNKATLFYSDARGSVDQALSQLNSAIEEIKKEFTNN